MNWITKKLFIFLLICACNPALIAQSHTIFTIGDSTMSDKKDPDQNPEKGWGQMLGIFLPENYTIQNHAINGRSTRSFINEGRWENVRNQLKKDDLVLIQFGHNDQKSNDPKRYTNPHTAYRYNLIKFIEETRAEGAIPILLTSIVRRNFNEEGTLVDTHGDYPLVVRLIAREYEVPLIDLQYLTEQMEESYGIQDSKKLHLHFEPGEHPYFPEGKHDDTHLSKLGATNIAKMVAEALQEMKMLTSI